MTEEAVSEDEAPAPEEVEAAAAEPREAVPEEATAEPAQVAPEKAAAVPEEAVPEEAAPEETALEGAEREPRAAPAMRTDRPFHRVVLLSGGFGGAKLAHGLVLAGAATERAPRLSLIVNTADDLEIHGLHVSPDLDTVMYTLAGLANDQTGWGVRDETWSGTEMLERLGAETWFRLGDRDLSTAMLRTAGLKEGRRLTSVTADLTRRLGLRAELLPMTDWPVRTNVRTDAGWLAFQDYFVRRGHEDEVRELRLDGIEAASATAEAMLAVAEAELLIIAPSNPFLSVGPILAVRGIIETIRRSRPRTVAVSPIVGGRALRGPADRLLESLGGEASAVGVARHYVERYPGLLQAFVIDWRDVGQLDAIEALGLRVLVTDTVMSSDEDRAVLARRILGFMSRGPGRRRR